MPDSRYVRLETGVVQFDDDWPGVFIRGDSAFGLLMMLEDSELRPLAVQQIKDLLRGSNVGHLDPHVQKRGLK